MSARPGRHVLVFPAAVVAVLVIGACASAHRAHAPSVDRLTANAPATDAAIQHFLNRVTFGVRPVDVDSIRALGFRAFLDRQMHPERIDDGEMDSRLASFQTLNLSSKQIAEQYDRPAEEARRNAATQPAASRPQPAEQSDAVRRQRLVLQELGEQKILRAVYSERELQEVLVDFWFNHFNVFAGKGADRGLLTAYERDVIRPRVFGRFRDMLGATAESPAMLFFLDNWLNTAAGGEAVRLGPRRAAARPAPVRLAGAQQAARGLNENYARELLELHTVGVDGGYTQRDVVEVARCFTGWTIDRPREGGTFKFDERRHDPGQKVVLGHVIKPGGGKNDGDRVLDILARDPHTARFVATKLVRRFVADDPPASLVDRAAARFRETDGDLREVYRAIFLSPEFWSERARAVKVKTPFEFLASALRATGARIEDASSTLQALRSLGMPPYFCQPPTGYSDRGDAWVTAGALLTRMNLALALVDGRLAGVRVDAAAVANGQTLAAARAEVARSILGTAISPATRTALDKAATFPQLVALALGAPEFQKK